MSGVTDPSPLSAEPIIEAWTVDLTYSHLATVRCLSLTSDQRLSLIATPAAFRSLGDLRCFLQSFTSASLRSPAQHSAVARRGALQWLSHSTASKATIYRFLICLSDFLYLRRVFWLSRQSPKAFLRKGKSTLRHQHMQVQSAYLKQLTQPICQYHACT